MTKPAAGTARPRVRTVGKLRDLLVLFTPERHTWGLTEMAQELDWDLATTHRLANALVEIDLLARVDGEGGYQLGVFAMQLGSVYLSAQPLRHEVVEAMESLARDTGLTTQIAVLAGDTVAIVDSRESASPLRAAALLGERLPLHATAVGKAILAQFSDEEVAAMLPERLEGFTAATITERDVLLERLAEVREAGIARVEDELSEGLSAVAVALPPRSYSTEIAALTCAGPSPSIAPERWAQAEATLLELHKRYAARQGAQGGVR